MIAYVEPITEPVKTPTKQKIRVLLLAIHYPFAIKNYFEKAFQHRGDVDLITVGPYTSNWIPWMGGMYLDKKYDHTPTIPLMYPMMDVNYDLIRANLPPSWNPDLVITIDAGVNWKNKPSEGYVVTIGTDPHVLDYDHARGISDKFFNMQECYSRPNDIYLPYAYSVYDHFPSHTVSRDVDAVLIGMPYPNRMDWVNGLRQMDMLRQLNNVSRNCGISKKV